MLLQRPLLCMLKGGLGRPMALDGVREHARPLGMLYEQKQPCTAVRRTHEEDVNGPGFPLCIENSVLHPPRNHRQRQQQRHSRTAIVFAANSYVVLLPFMSSGMCSPNPSTRSSICETAIIKLASGVLMAQDAQCSLSANRRSVYLPCAMIP